MEKLLNFTEAVSITTVEGDRFHNESFITNVDGLKAMLVS